VLVQGDTTTVMAAALLAFYHRIASGMSRPACAPDRWQPFPEEINRRIAGVVADLHFAPTEHSRQNLLKENVPDERLSSPATRRSTRCNSIVRLPAPPKPRPARRLDIGPGGKQLVLITAHRRENFGQPLEEICMRAAQLAESYPTGCSWFTPVHLNPNVQEPVYRLLGDVPTSP
jgi:UDP-N-acetylglucosamine 2-epimerase (non-hydrolysing)